MLCPICGGEVGNEIRLCDDCEAAAKRSQEPESPAAENVEGSEAADENVAPYHEAAASGSKKTVGVVVGLLLLTVGGCLYLIFGSSDSTPIATINTDPTLVVTSEGSETVVATTVDPAADPSAVNPTSASATPEGTSSATSAQASDPAPPGIDVTATTLASETVTPETTDATSAWVEIGKSRNYFNGSYVRLDASRPDFYVLEIGLFPEVLTDGQRKTLSEVKSFASLWPPKSGTVAPAAILTLRLKNADKELTTDDIISADLAMTRETGFLSFDGIDPEFKVSSDSRNPNRIGISYFKGLAENGGPLHLIIKGKARAQISMTLEVPFDWNFTLKSAMHQSH